MRKFFHSTIIDEPGQEIGEDDVPDDSMFASFTEKNFEDVSFFQFSIIYTSFSAWCAIEADGQMRLITYLKGWGKNSTHYVNDTRLRKKLELLKEGRFNIVYDLQSYSIWHQSATFGSNFSQLEKVTLSIPVVY